VYAGERLRADSEIKLGHYRQARRLAMRIAKEEDRRLMLKFADEFGPGSGQTRGTACASDHAYARHSGSRYSNSRSSLSVPIGTTTGFPSSRSSPMASGPFPAPDSWARYTDVNGQRSSDFA
jgi:hypothetical protein